VGGLIGFMTSWLVHRSERATRIAERSRADRKDAYAALLTHAEHSLHLFEWLAEGQFSPAGMEGDKARANTFYDQEVTPRYMVLKIMGKPKVVAAAGELRLALNGVRHLMVDGKRLPTAESTEFKTAHGRYRAARDKFTEIARADLDTGNDKLIRRRRFRLVRGTGEHPH
jgi:hypothetical protein